MLLSLALREGRDIFIDITVCGPDPAMQRDAGDVALRRITRLPPRCFTFCKTRGVSEVARNSRGERGRRTRDVWDTSRYTVTLYCIIILNTYIRVRTSLRDPIESLSRAGRVRGFERFPPYGWCPSSPSPPRFEYHRARDTGLLSP